MAAHDELTVSVITSLIFERYDSTYVDLDANPGNGQPKTNLGQRIYPDMKAPSEALSRPVTDRSLVKVTAVFKTTMQPGTILQLQRH